MLGRQFAALGEAAAGEDVAVGRSHVALVPTVLSYAVEEGFHREDVLVWELRGTVFGRVCGVHPMESFPGLIECSLGRPIIDIITTTRPTMLLLSKATSQLPANYAAACSGLECRRRIAKTSLTRAETTAAPTPGTTPVPITRRRTSGGGRSAIF